MSALTFPEWPAADIAAAAEKVPSVNLILAPAKAFYDQLVEEGNKFGAIHDATGQAEEAVQTSEIPEAVNYREYSAKIEAGKAAREAERKAWEEEQAIKWAALDEAEKQEAALKETAVNAVAATLVQGAGDPTKLSASYQAAYDQYTGLGKLVAKMVPDITLPKFPTTDQVVRGRQQRITSADKEGAETAFRPRLGQAWVDGKEVFGPEKDGKVGYPTFAEIAKASGFNIENLKAAFETKIGGRAAWKDRTEPFEFVHGSPDGGKSATIRVTPRPAAEKDAKEEAPVTEAPAVEAPVTEEDAA